MSDWSNVHLFGLSSAFFNIIDQKHYDGWASGVSHPFLEGVNRREESRHLFLITEQQLFASYSMENSNSMEWLQKLLFVMSNAVVPPINKCYTLVLWYPTVKKQLFRQVFIENELFLIDSTDQIKGYFMKCFLLWGTCVFIYWFKCVLHCALRLECEISF